MTVEEVGSGWKLTYKIVGPDAPGPIYSTVLTQLEVRTFLYWSRASRLDKRWGSKQIDGRHTVGVVKFQGKEMGISKGEPSPNGKILKVETDYADSNPIRKEIQYRDRQ